MSLWCKCLAAFDRWASTSQYVNIRLWSNVKRGHILLLTIIILWALLASPNIPLSYSAKIDSIWRCIISNKTYFNYYAYFVNLVAIFLFPLLVFSYFGFRTYVHISRLTVFRRAQLFERQLTRMILYQVFITIFSSLSYGIQFIYTTLTSKWSKTPLWLAIDNVISHIGRLCLFVNSISAFYNVSTSKEIQLMIKNVLENYFQIIAKEIESYY